MSVPRPTWAPASYADAVDDATLGRVFEHHYLELKTEYTTKQNAEMSGDLAALANDSGVLVVGVDEDKATGVSTAVTPFVLKGFIERVEQVARSLDCTTLADPSNPAEGLVLIRVPASELAPHVQRRVHRLTDAEVEALMRRRAALDPAGSPLADGLAVLDALLVLLRTESRQWSGKDVLVPRPSKYPEEFRRDAVALVRSSSGRPLREIGRELGVNHETLRGWVNAAKQADENAARGRDDNELSPHTETWERDKCAPSQSTCAVLRSSSASASSSPTAPRWRTSALRPARVGHGQPDADRGRAVGDGEDPLTRQGSVNAASIIVRSVLVQSLTRRLPFGRSARRIARVRLALPREWLWLADVAEAEPFVLPPGGSVHRPRSGWGSSEGRRSGAPRGPQPTQLVAFGRRPAPTPSRWPSRLA